MLPPSANLAMLCLVLAVPFTATAGPAVAISRSLSVLPTDMKRSAFLAMNRSSFLPEEPKLKVGSQHCGETRQVHSGSNKKAICPDECPYYAQNKDDALHCSFVCIEASQCTKLNKWRPIADVINGHKICRGPLVEHCSEFNYDGTDTCARCQWLYGEDENGLCEYQHWAVLIIIIMMFILMVVFGMAWVLDLAVRPVSNQDALDAALEFRTLQTVRDQNGCLDEDGNRKIDDKGVMKAPEQFPIGTNLCHTQVAGPGMLLHFRFQVAVIAWAASVGCGWLLMAICIDWNMMVIGTRQFGTPRENCILVAWGYEKQHELMWTKVSFLCVLYSASFVGSLLYGITQLRLYQSLDAKTKTMKDFVAVVSGLPFMDGSDETIEERVHKAFEEAAGEEIIGVSVCWLYAEQEDWVNEVLEQDLADREKAHKEHKAPPELDDPVYRNPLRKWYHGMEKNAEGGDEEDKTEEDILKTLKEITTSDEAFVVFKTEKQKDDIVKKLQEKGTFELKGICNECYIEKKEAEPDTVNWVAFGNSTRAQRMGRTIQGFGYILLALCFWTLVFYVPYAWSIMGFNYDNGAQPPFTFAMTFTMVVVLGNAIMYEVCARVSDYICFKYRDDRESCYMLLYTMSCMFNVTLDFVTTYLMAWEIMKGLGFRTYHGVKLEDVPGGIEGFTIRFETFAMQRILAENTKAYCFPSTFLIPFLIEPFITIIFPMWAGMWLVRTHPKIQGREAEGWLGSCPFDMGRYADLLLDVLLGSLIFFFPGGYTVLLFFGMAGAHSYIYWFDHYRVIRSIPACTYSSYNIEWWAQAMFAPCLSLILMALVLKANGEPYSGYNLTGWPFLELQWAAFILHSIVHILFLLYFVPLFSLSEEQQESADEHGFEDVAKGVACTWFTANPVHCLRARYMLKQQPPCTYWFLGKNYLLQADKARNTHFTCEREHLDANAYGNFLGKQLSKVSSKFKKKAEAPKEEEAKEEKAEEKGEKTTED